MVSKKLFSIFSLTLAISTMTTTVNAATQLKTTIKIENPAGTEALRKANAANIRAEIHTENVKTLASLRADPIKIKAEADKAAAAAELAIAATTSQMASSAALEAARHAQETADIAASIARTAAIEADNPKIKAEKAKIIREMQARNERYESYAFGEDSLFEDSVLR